MQVKNSITNKVHPRKRIFVCCCHLIFIVVVCKSCKRATLHCIWCHLTCILFVFMGHPSKTIHLKSHSLKGVNSPSFSRKEQRRRITQSLSLSSYFPNTLHLCLQRYKLKWNSITKTFRVFPNGWQWGLLNKRQREKKLKPYIFLSLSFALLCNKM